MSQDEEAARASGIAIGRYKAKCFLVAAFAAIERGYDNQR